MLTSFRRLTAVLLVLALALSLTGAAAASQMGIVRIDILAVNDFHGALAAEGKNPGAAALAAYLRAERDKNPAGTLVLSAGDMFQGTPDSNLLHGKTVVEVMNAVSFDAMALGNHEFDWGLDVLRERKAQAAFPMLSANILDKSNGRRAELVAPYVILERGGVKIAVVGLTTPDTAVTTSPRNVQDFVFADPAAMLKALIPELKAKGADVVVALAHLASYPGEAPGDEADDLVAAVGGDLAAVVSGHSHLRVTDNDVMPVVQGYYNGRSVAAVHIAYSTVSRQVLGATAEVKDVPPGFAPDRQVAAIVAAAQNEIAPVKGLVLGRAETALPHDRFQLSPLGQWSTDAMRQAAKADIALCNGGGLRTGLAAGPVTLGDMYAVMPFDNDLNVAEMTGAQVLAALEYGIANPKYGTLQFSGLTVDYRAAAPIGRRVAAATMADGSLLEADKTYLVAVSDFLIAGGDGYDMIKAAARHTNTFLTLRAALAEAVRKAGVIRFQGDGRLKELSRSAAMFIAA